MVHRLEVEHNNHLVVIGIHAGKFTAERVTNNIRAATQRLGVTHPVLNDRQFRTWRAYGVQAWPTVALVSPDGQYMGQHAGEFTFDDFDAVVRAAIEAYSKAGLLSDRPLHFQPDPFPLPDSALLFPSKVATGTEDGRLFIADTGHNRVLITRLNRTGEEARVEQIIGGAAGFEDGPFSQAALHHPQGLAFEGHMLYIADTENHSIRAADLNASALKTVAGNGQIGYDRSAGVGASAQLNSPWDLLVREGWLYIAMAGTHQLWRLNLETTAAGPFVGSGRENIDDGPNSRATLAQPSGLASDGKRLIFADSESSAVRAADFSPDGYTQTLLGRGLFEFGDKDGKATQALLQHNLGVAYHQGKVYIADTYNNKIKWLDLTAMECHTALGSGDPQDMYEPGGLVVWSEPNGHHLYIADTNNHRLLHSIIDAEGKLTPPVPVTIRL